MHLEPDAVQSLLQYVELTSWLRIMKSGHKDTPLGCGFGSSRFSSPTNTFKVIYLGETIGTSLAETVVRDRLEAVPTSERFLLLSEISQWAIAEISSKQPLRLLDLTGDGPLRLGVSTEAVGAKAHSEGQAFSEALHQQFPDIDGVMFLSRLTRARCVAVYDRSIDLCLEAGPAVGLEQLVNLPRTLQGLFIRLIDDLS